MDAVVTSLAERQHGVVSAAQLRALGVDRQVIQRRVSRGALHRLHRGVYAVGRPTVRWEGRQLAAVLACGPQAVLSHRSAAQVWGLMPRFAIHPEVTRPTQYRGHAGILLHRSPLRRSEVAEVSVIPVTSVARTMLDVAATVDKWALERAWNEMEVRELWDPVGIPRMIARHPGRHGVVALREAMSSQRPTGRVRNEFEWNFVRFVDDYSLPRPRLNAHLALRGRFFEIDAFWEPQRLAVELDGGAVHSTRRAFQTDRERDRILLAEGFRTARVTWDQLRDEPAEIAADLRQALAPGPHPHRHGR
ncbi:MAG TPA: type IV toxin-antitoxin system AbiEi family antitoxin domain-containing protein [Solirubrobacterales bacterium]|nr:type IV toxin-antitoxin system AbiEi family antitoxin domain-containing protein [Solirubrobacterales bacterium]